MRQARLDTFNNSWYKPGRGFFTRAVWYWVNACVFKSSCPWNGLKIFLLRAFGAKVGTGIIVKPCVNIKYPWKLTIGDHVWIGENVWIDNLADVTLESHVCLSQGAFLLCGNHNYKKSSFDLMIGAIIIRQGVWIGAKSIVCPGITVGEHAVLTVASVATTDLEPFTIYQGNPAQALKKREIM